MKTARRFLLVWSLTTIATGQAIKTKSVKILIKSKEMRKPRLSYMSRRSLPFHLEKHLLYPNMYYEFAAMRLERCIERLPLGKTLRPRSGILSQVPRRLS